jgi:hypothetical protein
MNTLKSHRGAGASRVLATAAILLAGLASFAAIDAAAAGKGGDNRAPKAAALTTQGQIERARDVRGDRPEKTANESCTGIHCRDHAGDHHHQH